MSVQLGKLNLRIIYLAWMPGLFWFRFFGTGYGLYFSDSRVHGVPFSERMGISQTLHIERWRIWVLKPEIPFIGVR